MPRSFLSCLLVAGVMSVAACGPAHVQLVAPPAHDAPIDQRRAYYDEHRPIVVRTSGTWMGAPLFMILENGQRIDHLADLATVVGPASPTALAAERANDAEEVALGLNIAGGIAYTLGLGTIIVSGAMLTNDATPPGEVRIPDAALIALLSGTGVAVVGVALPAIGFIWTADAARERETALLTYERSLRDRLALTKDDITPLRPTATMLTPGKDVSLVK